MPRKSSFTHPNLYSSERSPILNLVDEEFVTPGPEGVPDIAKIYFSLEEYFADLTTFHEVRMKLRIPEFSYVSASFCSRTYPALDVMRLIMWAREFYEVRWWVNRISAAVLICIADTDLTENAGMNFWQKAKVIDTYKSLGMPSWYEFCAYGIQIPADWKLDQALHLSPPLIRATSPDGKYGYVIGGV